MPRQGDWVHRDFPYVDEGLVEGELVLVREGDQLARVPSAMDSVNIAPLREPLSVEGV